jgi:ferritin-like metal-binding protein YciE
MARAASDNQLRTGFEEHLNQTHRHVERLQNIFDELQIKGKGKKCLAMEGLIKEGQELMREDIDPEALDAGLIAAAQRVEHYEIASYGTARTYAQALGLSEAASLLEETLEEEKATDRKLTELAEGGINAKAMESDDEAEEVEDEMEEE